MRFLCDSALSGGAWLHLQPQAAAEAEADAAAAEGAAAVPARAAGVAAAGASVTDAAGWAGGDADVGAGYVEVARVARASNCDIEVRACGGVASPRRRPVHVSSLRCKQPRAQPHRRPPDVLCAVCCVMCAVCCVQVAAPWRALQSLTPDATQLADPAWCPQVRPS